MGRNLILGDLSPLRMHLLAHGAGMTVAELEAMPAAVIAMLDRGVDHGIDVGTTIGHVNAALAWRQKFSAAVIAGVLGAVVAFSAGWVAAPRPSAVIPSAPQGAASSDQPTTGASLEASGEVVAVSPAVPTVEAERSGAPSFDPGSFPPVGFGVVDPTTRPGDVSTGTNPDLTPPPTPRRDPAPAVRVGHPYGAPVTGRASYYGTGGPGMYAALPGRWIRNRTVRVCGPARCNVVRIVTTCGCYTNTRSGKIIDLSIPEFEYVTGWSPAKRAQIGVTTVTITVYRPGD